jgi:DNA polymerase III subunit delta'
MTPAWLQPVTTAVRQAYDAQRLPHAVLIHETAGAGGDWLAQWLTQLVLCSDLGAAPCGTCVSCQRCQVQQHPDARILQLQEDAQQLKIEQVRELIAELALTSHQGGYKVGVILQAERLNRFAANALLKTLEEPPANTLLILVTHTPSLLPATIRSRCQKLFIPAPDRPASLTWLEQQHGSGPWDTLLTIFGERPMLVAKVDGELACRLATEVDQALTALSVGKADPLFLAEQWQRNHLDLRIRCFENWLTKQIRGLATSHLSGEAIRLRLCKLFDLMDGVRELKASLETSINKSLALESVLRRFGDC